MQVEGLSNNDLANMLGVSRASVSHVLSGRNKPGYDFIEGLTRAFPGLNIEWLITGKGRMNKSGSVLGDPAPASDPATQAAAPAEAPQKAPEAQNSRPDAQSPANSETSGAQDSPAEPIQGTEGKRFIRKILVFYSDGTFEEIS